MAGGRTHMRHVGARSAGHACASENMGLHIQEHIPLRDLTTLKIGGLARYFVSVSDTGELLEAVLFAQEKRLPVIVLGGGSNVLVSDGEIDALVVRNEMRGIEWTPLLIPPLRGGEGKGGEDFVLVTAGAGESWDALVSEAVRRGYWGIENLSGIPGTVGAAPIQNIGAYGTEVKEVVEWVEVFDTVTGETRKLANVDCRFAYRDSVFKHAEGKGLIITRVVLQLSKNGKPTLGYKDLKYYFSPSLEGENRRGGVPPTLAEIRNAVLQIRSKKFPDLRTHGTAGSFFKNPTIPLEQFNTLKKKYPDLPGFPLNFSPSLEGEIREGVKIPLAWILHNICGLKDYRKGNVALFERQPIVLVQNGLATSKEIELFVKEIAEKVKEKVGIEVEWEVQKIF